MTELTREQIETVRVLAQHYDGTAVELFGVSVRTLCDMALRTHDAAVAVQAEKELSTYWMERAVAAEDVSQRAEAECERLREQAEEMAKRQAITQYWLDRANNTISAMSLETALATPPPEGEPQEVGHSPTREYDTEDMDAVYSDPRNPVNTPHTPERSSQGLPVNKMGYYAPQQAHGDALAALYRLSSYTADDYCDSPHARWHDTAAVRQALTASGVPYVPDSVWRNLTKIEQDAPRPFSECACAVKRELASAPAGEVVVTTKDGECVSVTRQDSEGQILSVIWERESAPADGWKPVPGVVRDHFHAVRDCLIDQAREYEYGDEDNPNAIACRSAVDWLDQVIAAAPQRGGEHD